MSEDRHAQPTGRAAEPLYDLDIPTPTHAERARTLVARIPTGTLCTLALEPKGYPYGSFVTVAFDEGNPVLLISLPGGDTVKTIDLGEYRAPHDLRWVDAERVVVTSEAGVSHMLALSTDRTRLYCSNMRDGSVSAFDFKTGAKIKDVKTGATPL